MTKKKTEKTDALASLRAIRSETVLSRLPVHNLVKGGTIDVQITKRDSKGEVNLRWNVVYSKLGQPGQLSYKLDTLIVNKRLDEERRALWSELDPQPLPKQIRLGSLTEICREMDLANNGTNKAAIKQALQQNAATFIQAKLNYRAVDGKTRWLDAFFNRYSVVFTGERFSDGRTADAVYLILSDTYWEVLNTAPFRPLDYAYLKKLAPTAQRFYELLSYRIYAALKNGYPTARMAYSEYCTYTALTRYFDYDHFKKQMYKVHRPHVQSGYLAKVRYEAATDSEGNADWIMIYTPGPRARAEFEAFGKKGFLGDVLFLDEATEAQAKTPTEEHEAEAAALVEAMRAEGVTATWARKYVAGLDEAGRLRARHVLDYYQTVLPDKSWANPPGVLRRLMELEAAEGVAIPTRGRRVSTEHAASNHARDAAIQREAIEFLAEQRRVDAEIDAALARTGEKERGELTALAEAACQAIKGFAHWTPAAQARERERQLRKVVRTTLIP